MQKNDCYILLYHTPSYVCWSDHHAFRIFQCIIPLPHPLILVPTPQRCDLKWDIRPHSWSCIGISKYFFFYFQYFMFVILQLFNIILIYMGAVECLKEKAEHECIYILLLLILYKEDVDIECDIFFFVIALCNLFFI